MEEDPEIVACVLTGGPGVGKSTTLALLKERGYAIVPEAARAVILEELAKVDGATPERNLAAFQELVAKRQSESEEKIGSGITFLDRSVLDGVAYCRLGRAEVPAIIFEHLKKVRYAHVFLLDLLPDHKNDEARWEGFDTARAIHAEIESAYREFGYDPIRIPAVSPEERVEHILSVIHR